MQILVMVLSYNETPYAELMNSQKETWAKAEVYQCKTIFYRGGTVETSEVHQHYPLQWVDRGFNITDAYYYMHGKFKKVLEANKDVNFDFIFRTNSSSYINRKRLMEFAERLPKEKCYAGAEIKTNEGFSICSGAGFWITPDMAEILRNEIDPEFEKEEDYYIGSILNKHGIEVIDDKSRVDVDSFFSVVPLDRYHYRFKTNNRLHDAHNMKLLHDKILEYEKNNP